MMEVEVVQKNVDASLSRFLPRSLSLSLLLPLSRSFSLCLPAQTHIKREMCAYNPPPTHI